MAAALGFELGAYPRPAFWNSMRISVKRTKLTDDFFAVLGTITLSTTIFQPHTRQSRSGSTARIRSEVCRSDC